MIVFDCETTPQGELVVIGIMRNGKYKYFSNAQDFWIYLKKKKENQVFAHNLEFDFFKVYEYLPQIKFCAYYSSAGLSYIQAGNIFFKDLYNHLPFSLRAIGHLLNTPKLTIDYSKIKKITPELIRYNRRDCLVCYKAVKFLEEIYLKEGSNRVKSTTGSQAMNIFLRKFHDSKFFKIDKKIIEEWRTGYKGGWVDCFEKGTFTNNTFYKIDINSLFPFLMRSALPFPYHFKKVNWLSDRQRKKYFWIGMYRNEYYDLESINSVEYKEGGADYYYLFYKKCYPFRAWVDYFYNKKVTSQRFEYQVYKKLMNSLYGKFGQKNILDIVSNYKFKESDRLISRVPISDNLYRLQFDNDYNKFWVNIVWSLFITAKAREYMRNLRRYIIRKGLRIYYIDTDAFIVSGDIERISSIINKDKLGLFKIEDISNSIDIRGKKFYRFGDSYKCKGVPEQYRKEFFDNNSVQFKKMVRYKEALVRGLRLGSFIDYEKRNLRNRRSN